MFKQRFKLYSLAKLNSLEILIEERIQYVGSSQSRFFETYLKNQKILKRKVIITKIFSSIIFSVLPLLPLLTFIEIEENLLAYSIDVIVFTGSILFSLYFLLQFFNFFLLGIFNVSLIISGRIFRWYETFPLPRDKLRRLIHLTIFRSLDLPIIVSLFAFPIIILVGTQNFVMFLMCSAMSFLVTYISFNLLIIVGERLNRNLDINEIGSRKTFGIRMVNIFSYFVIIVSSVYIIQWALGSLEYLFNWFLATENSSTFNLIFSVIIFPFTPSYLISLFITPLAVPLELWLMTLLGISILILIAIRINRIALQNLEKSTYLKYDEDKKKFQTSYGKKIFQIKIKSPVLAYIRKDLLTSTRNLKTFMAFIMPIVLSVVFKFSFNLSMIGITVPIESKMVYDWMMTIAFNLILTAMITHNLLNIEESGETILASLPIIPREQAKAKLLLIIIVQIIATLIPNFLYIYDTQFLNHLIVSIIAIPMVLIFLAIIFEMRVYYFGKIKNRYILSEIRPQNAFMKWILIVLSNYFIFYWLMVIGMNLYMIWGIQSLINLTLIIVFILLIPIYIIFDSLFPYIRFQQKVESNIFLHKVLKESGKPTWFSRHIWMPSILLILFFSIVEIISMILVQNWLMIYPFYENNLDSFVMIMTAILLFNLPFIGFVIFALPKFIGLPYGRKTTKSFLKDIYLDWIPKIFKMTFLGIIIGILFYLFVLIVFHQIFPMSLVINPNLELLSLLMLFMNQFWFEIVKLIVLKTYLKKFSLISSLTLTSLLSITNILLPFNFMIGMYSIIFIRVIFLFVYNILTSIIYLKTKSIIPVIFLIIFTTFISINPFYF